MSVSLPSKEVYVIDVPEPTGFSAVFQYNFFTPDESVNETGTLPQSFKLKQSENRGLDYQVFAASRAPRWVKICWKPVYIKRLASLSVEQEAKKVNTPANQTRLIAENYDKIVTEDYLSTVNFAVLKFQDGNIDEKLFVALSGSHVKSTIDDPTNYTDNAYRAALRTSALAPRDVNPEFVHKVMTQPINAFDIEYHKNEDRRSAEKQENIDRLRGSELRRVSIGSIVNTRILPSLVDKAALNPIARSPLTNISKIAQSLKSAVDQKGISDASDEDYKTFLPAIETSSSSRVIFDTTLIGYVVDKMEVLMNGSVKEKKSIIVESSKTVETIDFEVKYGSQYAYQVRAIYKFTVPAIEERSGKVSSVSFLVSSKPTEYEYVETIENVSPPPPADFNFTWNFQQTSVRGKSGRLMLHWSFPPNSQRDIKQFQIFRRNTIDHPFELIKVYHFDDSVKQHDPLEDYDQSLVEKIDSPATWWYDDEFDRTSKYIYTVCCVDAHGYLSNYGPQFELSFDMFKNRLIKKFISRSGAPRQYPNLFLNDDLFVDTIRVSGETSKKLVLYFNPEYYRMIDDQGKSTPIIGTKQDGGSYKLQFINLDNQKEVLSTITIDDLVGRVRKDYRNPQSSEMTGLNQTITDPGTRATRSINRLTNL